MGNYVLEFAFAIGRYFDQLGPLNASLLISAVFALVLIGYMVDWSDYRPKVVESQKSSRLADRVGIFALSAAIGYLGWSFTHTSNNAGQVSELSTVPAQDPPAVVISPPIAASIQRSLERCNPCTGPQFIQSREFILLRQPDSHFYAQASIAGMRTNFMVDTGASFVALPVWMANQVGVRQLSPVTSSTANGLTQAWVGVIPEMTVEGAIMHNVEAIFYTNLATAPLLGQSALRQFNIEQRDDRMYFHARSL